ncbi:MAG: hypothetical protein ACXWVS_02885 [Hyphomicrobium sp.]|jgi:hypothetical protein
MALPTVSIDNREIILLSGFKTVTSETAPKKPFVVILDERQLERSVKNDNNDAVAYGYVAGRWIAVA